MIPALYFLSASQRDMHLHIGMRCTYHFSLHGIIDFILFFFTLLHGINQGDVEPKDAMARVITREDDEMDMMKWGTKKGRQKQEQDRLMVGGRTHLQVWEDVVAK